MGEGCYKIRDQSEVHFLSFAVVEWIDLFTRQCYRDIVLNSLEFLPARDSHTAHLCRRVSFADEFPPAIVKKFRTDDTPGGTRRQQRYSFG